MALLEGGFGVRDFISLQVDIKTRDSLAPDKGAIVGIKEVRDGIRAVMIWDTSIWRRECSNHSKIHSAQKCYLCLRYVV